MTLTQAQIKKLSANLEPQHIKTRTKANFELSYIEGWHVIAEANRIFGFDGWDRITDVTALGEPRLLNEKWHVSYMAKCKIVVRADGADVVRTGIGYGSGVARNVGDAYEGAIKEAETDAMKRAFSTWGNVFGLALYDKEKRNVGPNYRSKAECREDYEAMQAEIDASDSPDAIHILGSGDDWREKVTTMPPDWQEELRERFYNKRQELEDAQQPNEPPF